MRENTLAYVAVGLVTAGVGAFVLARRRAAGKRVHAAIRAEHERSQQFDEAERERDAERQRHAQEAEVARRREELEVAAAKLRRRQEALVAKFGEKAAAQIRAKELWVGATKAMVIESLGQPEDVSEKVFKTKTKTVFKYYRSGARFGLKVKFEDDEVVGWDK